VSKIRWSRSHNAAADLIVHARTTSIHPPISAVHPEFDKPSTCINASIRPATGTRCGPGCPIAAALNLVVLMFVGARMRHRYSRYVARVSLPHHRAQLVSPRVTTAAQKAGQSITINHNAFGATEGSRATALPAAAVRNGI
jgi:hypothetical protein